MPRTAFVENFTASGARTDTLELILSDVLKFSDLVTFFKNCPGSAQKIAIPFLKTWNAACIRERVDLQVICRDYLS